MTEYVHGYSERETQRLFDQAASVRDLLHHDTRYDAGARVLEAGCGVGAQTVTLARNSPDAHFVSIDIAEDSLAEAAALIEREHLTNVAFRRADVYDLPFDEASFDHVFVCYLLEHVPDPDGALTALARVLKPGGTMTVIEGDHGSCRWHPETDAARRAWQCLIDVQAALGGDSLIGRRLYPLLAGAGLTDVRVSPRMVYGDHSRPAVVDAFWARTIIPMVHGVHDRAIEMGLIDAKTWTRGVRELHLPIDRTDGTFTYTFFNAVGVKG